MDWALRILKPYDEQKRTIEPDDSDICPGVIETDGSHVVRVIGVPSGTSWDDVKRQYEGTLIYPPRFIIPFDLLGANKIVKGRRLTTKMIESEKGIKIPTVKSAIQRGYLPAIKEGRTWFIHENDFELWQQCKAYHQPGAKMRMTKQHLTLNNGLRDVYLSTLPEDKKHNQDRPILCALPLIPTVPRGSSPTPLKFVYLLPHNEALSDAKIKKGATTEQKYLLEQGGYSFLL